MRRTVVARLGAAIAVVALTLIVSGCANDTLAQQYRSGGSQNYISGDGTITEIALKDWAAPVRFAGKDENGSFTISYNVVEAIVAIWAGTAASSAALIGFGLDSAPGACWPMQNNSGCASTSPGPC